MTHTIFQTPEYSAIMQKHIKEVILYLFEQNTDFSIACDIEYTDFNPELPSDIKDSFNETVLFVLSGYTLESAKLHEKYFSFEAGFGSDNIGSTLMLPLLSIKQIFVDNNPIIINFIDYEALQKSEKPKDKGSTKNSMEALLNNPKNKKLLKKSLKPKS